MTAHNNAEAATGRTDWASVVEHIRSGDPSGGEHLYQILTDKCRARLGWGVNAQGIEDSLHDIVVDVLQAIHAGTLREPACLMGFTKTLTRRRVARHIRGNIAVRKRFVSMGQADFPAPSGLSAEAVIEAGEQAETLRRTLQCIRPRDRDLLIRYYCFEQNPVLICQEMNLTSNQFRLFKSRALARCAEVARRARQDPSVRTKPRPHIWRRTLQGSVLSRASTRF